MPLPAKLPLATPHAREVLAVMPRREHPRPTMVRERWLPLHGEWEFRIGHAGPYPQKIRVPFAPESALSGLFLGQQVVERVGYRRTLRIPPEWRGMRVRLWFEAVDWEAVVRLDGVELGRHRGGYDRFGFLLPAGLDPAREHVLEVDVTDPADPARDGWQPRGKQLGSHSIWYTRTTGIWRPVWLEAVPESAEIERLRVRADADGTFAIAAAVRGEAAHLRLRVPRPDGSTFEQSGPASGPLRGRIAGAEPWSPEQPVLHAAKVALLAPDGTVLDEVDTRLGFRTVSIVDGQWRLNGEPRFVRGVLDQGYWPAGGMTAPSAAALEADVALARRLGFDLARKHVKVEDELWYDACDRLGLLVMQDMPSSMSFATEPARANFRGELAAVVEQLQNHPSVVHWVVINEDWGKPGAFQTELVQWLRGQDPTRTLTDASGWTQRDDTDFVDVHDYGGDLTQHAKPGAARPVWIGECGGIAFFLPGHVWSEGWGYTTAPDAGAFVRRIHRLLQPIQQQPGLGGFIWTQLTDVEQELNGLVHYDRTPKVDVDRLRAVIRGEVELPPAVRVERWSLLGPLPAGMEITPQTPKEAVLAAFARTLDAETIADEVSLAPPRGGAWRDVAPGTHVLDLRELLPGCEDCVCYAAGVVEVPADGSYRLSFGSDDAARVWIDGRAVHRVVAIRGVSPGQDEVSGIALGAGRHQVLVKIVQGWGGAGFALGLEREP